MFSREFGRQKTAKTKIYFTLRVAGLPVWLSIWGGCGVHWVQVVGATLAILLVLAKMDKIPSFCPLSRFAFGALALNMALFGFLRAFSAGFGVRMYVCMGLGFCVDCGAFYVRERLGGFRACGDFLQNLSFVPSFCFPLSSSFVLSFAPFVLL